MSVTDTLDNAKILKLLPLFAKKKLAKGAPIPGVVKMTTAKDKPGHMTWWIPKDATPWTNFKVVA